MLDSDISDVGRFAPQGASGYVIEQVEEAKREIERRRPLPIEIVRRLESEILADRVHSSAVTEGNRLSKRETLVVLASGVIEAGARKDVIEVRNLAEAIAETEQAIRRSEPITPHFLRALQGLLLKDIERQGVGAFRSENVAISGALAQPPNFQDVAPLVELVTSIISTRTADVHPIQLAAWAHWAIARIHPFRDGNGRLARLVQDFILLSHHYVPAPLRSEDREGLYYEALEQADQGQGQALLEIVAKNTLRMADRYVSLIKEQESKTDWIKNISIAAAEKVKQTDHRRFLNVQRALANLKAEFADVVKQLNVGVPNLRVRFADYGDIEFEKFQDIERGRFAKKAWLWGVEFSFDETTLRYVFWYAAHMPGADDPVHIMPSRLTLLVSVQQGTYYTRLDEIDEDRISLRAVMPDQSKYWRKRFDPTQGRNVWDENQSAGEISRAFFQEVLGKLGLL